MRPLSQNHLNIHICFEILLHLVSKMSTPVCGKATATGQKKTGRVGRAWWGGGCEKDIDRQKERGADGRMDGHER